VRDHVLAHEEDRRAEAELARRTAEVRRALAQEISAELEELKQEIVALHEGRAAAELQLRLLEEEIQRDAATQRRLWQECRDSNADLNRLRRALGSVLAEARQAMTRGGTGDD
jgi:chromosome segregation ATPase